MKFRTTAYYLIGLALLVTSEADARHSDTIYRNGPLVSRSYANKRCLKESEKFESSIALPEESLLVRGGANTSAPLQRLKVGFYFSLWYALNVVYNIVNKKVLNVLPAPTTVGSLQFLVGALYSSFLWTTGLRTAPKLTKAGKNAVSQIGVFHAAGQILTMIALESAPVSFTHIVKALEPLFSALVSALLLGKWMKPQVYATLIPVVCGVGYACLKERFFSWIAFNAAMASNLAFALRAVCSKTAMSNPVGENITATNLFGLVTWMAFFVSIPVVVGLEGTSFLHVWKSATETTLPLVLVRQIVISGLFHYLNNEVMYLALSNVHPVTLAVGNTMKRVFIMVASVMVFRNPISFQAGVGAAVGILGVLLYSLTKQYYEKLEIHEKQQRELIVTKKQARGGKRN